MSSKHKLKDLLQYWPGNTLAVTPWLEKQQISLQLTRHYLKSGWIEKVGNGVYKRKGDRVDWRGAVFALQQGLELKVHVGGITALELIGESHFVSLAKQRLCLFNNGSEHPRRLLPKWLIEHFSDSCLIEYYRRCLFKSEVGLQNLNCGNFEIRISSRERALLEILSLVPQKISFEHAALLFQGKATLRPDLVQVLLGACLSQQTNRLFVHLARKNQYDFIQHLNLRQIDFGHGRRVIKAGKVFDSALNLYLPILNSDEQDQIIGI